MRDQTIVIPPGTKDTRVDVFLANHTDLSRSQLQKHIKSGIIQVNQKKISPHQIVRAGDSIVIGNLDLTYTEQAKPKTTDQPEIIFEDDDVLVMNKPSGWVVHGGPGIYDKTVADWAVEHDQKISEVGDRPDQRPGIVHRLDRDVSGLMVIAKTQEAFEHLKKQFQNHTIIKEYIALTHGRITDKSGKIAFAIGRKKDKSGLMVARPNSTEGKEAETRFSVERHVKNLSLVRVRTMTGRGHQIRVHFKAISHPLVGDKLYRKRGQKPLRVEPPRIFLHATVLGFNDLSGKDQRFEAALPDDLQQYLGRIG